jgi:hypothetical protein
MISFVFVDFLVVTVIIIIIILTLKPIFEVIFSNHHHRHHLTDYFRIYGITNGFTLSTC